MSKYCSKNKWLLAAATEAEKSTMVHRIGCVAVLNNRIVASGFNNDGFTRVNGQRLRAHAESCVIARLRRSCAKERYAQSGTVRRSNLSGRKHRHFKAMRML